MGDGSLDERGHEDGQSPQYSYEPPKRARVAAIGPALCGRPCRLLLRQRFTRLASARPSLDFGYRKGAELSFSQGSSTVSAGHRYSEIASVICTLAPGDVPPAISLIACCRWTRSRAQDNEASTRSLTHNSRHAPVSVQIRSDR